MNRKDLNSIKYMLLIVMIVGLHQLYQVINRMGNLSSTPEFIGDEKTEVSELNDEMREATGHITSDDNLSRPSSDRAPASLPDVKQVQGERKIISKIKGQFANTLSKDWEKKLYNKLKHGQSINTMINIEHLEGLIDDRGGKNFLMEHVVIKTTLPNGHHYSFHAMVNSESGDIVTTWNYQKSEHDHTVLKAKAFRR